MSAVRWGMPAPSHWPRTRVKYVCRFAGGGTPDKGNIEYWNGEIPWVSPKDMKSSEVVDTEDQITKAGLDSSAAKLVEPGAVLIVMRSGILRHSVPVAINRVPVTLNQDMRALIPSSTLEPRYLARLIEGYQRQFLNVWSKEGTTVESLESDLVADTEIAVPPLLQQRAIADYLDRELARLYGLVAAKERLIGLLAEKRRALITRAVTRGLDPHAPLSDSGIPWLGEIPAHWTAARMKFLATEPLSYGANEAGLEDDPTFPRFVRITDVDSEGNLRDATFKSLPPEVAEPYLLRDGDVLLARSGATVGKAFIYKPTWGVACFAGYLIRCRCNPILMQPDFLYAYTQTEPYWWQVREGTIQATIQNFSAEKYGDLVVTVPPLEEQKAIIAHIAVETAKLDALRAATERTIALLKERRAALIAAAVTGKLDVHGAEGHLDVVAD